MPKKVFSVASGGAAPSMWALVSGDSASVLQTMRRTNAASNDCLQPAMCLAIELARLTDVVCSVIICAGELGCTVGMSALLSVPGQVECGVYVNVGMNAHHVVSGFSDGFVLGVGVLKAAAIEAADLTSSYSSLLARCLSMEYRHDFQMHALK